MDSFQIIVFFLFVLVIVNVVILWFLLRILAIQLFLQSGILLQQVVHLGVQRIHLTLCQCVDRLHVGSQIPFAATQLIGQSHFYRPLVLKLTVAQPHRAGIPTVAPCFQVSCKALVDTERVQQTIVMHPGPINRGVELSGTVADGPRSVILQQVTNGLAVRMAVLFLVTGGTNISEE